MVLRLRKSWLYLCDEKGKNPETGKYDKSVKLHRLIMNAPAGFVVDHINHDPLDNRRENLRICTQAQNVMNRAGARKDSKSGLRGVVWAEANQKWCAYITVSRKSVNLGYYGTKEEAHEAYNRANKRFFGEFGGTQ